MEALPANPPRANGLTSPALLATPHLREILGPPRFDRGIMATELPLPNGDEIGHAHQLPALSEPDRDCGRAAGRSGLPVVRVEHHARSGQDSHVPADQPPAPTRQV